MPKKTATKEISKQEVFDVLAFAKAAYNSNYGGLITPSSVNQRMKDINMNPYDASETQINTALANPKQYEQSLRRIGEFFENTNMIFKRMINYSASIAAYDLSWSCTNVVDSKEYNSKEYKQDMLAVHDFLDRFNYKREFKRVSKQCMRQEAVYVSFRDDLDDKYVFQELPIDNCKITGKDPYGLVFDFDMNWFLSKSGVNINQYHPAFKKYVKILDANNTSQRKNAEYDIKKQDKNRNRSFMQWVQTSHEDDMWVFKLDEERIGHTPFFSAMYPDLYNTSLIRDLQKNKFIIQASKILIGLYPLNKDTKSGNFNNMMNIDPVTMGQFMGFVNSALPDAIDFTTAPVDDVKSFDNTKDDKSIQDDHNKTLAAMSGNNSRLIYAHDKMNIVEAMSSINVDEILAQSIYAQAEDFMDYYVNKMTTKYKFKFKFEGSEFTENRKERLEQAMTMAAMGIVLPHKIANAIGMDKRTLDRQLSESKVTNWKDMLTILETSHTQSGGAGNDANGRPEKKSADLSETGANSRDNEE